MVATTSNTIADARRLHKVIKSSCPKMDAKWIRRSMRGGLIEGIGNCGQ
jgi:hypothetical protein